MPHLSPLNWALAVPLFLTLTMLLISSYWWTQTPNLQICPPTSSTLNLFNKWNWA